jgi:hypothetical protein
MFAPKYRATGLGKSQATMSLKIDRQQTACDQLTIDAAPLGLGVFLADTEGADLVMAETDDTFILLAE